MSNGNEPEGGGGGGYCNPPTATQWKKGESGNPKGRPPKKKGESNFLILSRILEQKIELRLPDGKTKKVPIREAIIWKKAMLALKGDHKAVDWVESRDLAQDEFDIENLDYEEFLANL